MLARWKNEEEYEWLIELWLRKIGVRYGHTDLLSDIIDNNKHKNEERIAENDFILYDIKYNILYNGQWRTLISNGIALNYYISFYSFTFGKISGINIPEIDFVLAEYGRGERKYEQIVNMPQKGRKSFDIRIFKQIPAKMSLQSQCLCGLWEGSVEMKEARSGRWHLNQLFVSYVQQIFVEMKEARLGGWHI